MLGPWHAKPNARLPRTNCSMLGFKLVVSGECFMDARTIINLKYRASVFFLLRVFQGNNCLSKVDNLSDPNPYWQGTWTTQRRSWPHKIIHSYLDSIFKVKIDVSRIYVNKRIPPLRLRPRMEVSRPADGDVQREFRSRECNYQEENTVGTLQRSPRHARWWNHETLLCAWFECIIRKHMLYISCIHVVKRWHRPMNVCSTQVLLDICNITEQESADTIQQSINADVVMGTEAPMQY